MCGVRKVSRQILIAGLAVAAVLLILIPCVIPAAVEYVISAKIAEFGLFPDVRMNLGYCWRNGPGLRGDLRVAVVDSPWCVRAEFGCSCSEWSAAVKMKPTAFDETDPTLRCLLEKFPIPTISNLTFSGSIALDAKAERTFHTPVPVWTAKAIIRDLSAKLTVGEKEIAIEGLSITPGASGIADRRDISPMFLKVGSLSAAGFTLENLHASIRASEKALMITEASADFCGGTINLYSLFLNPQSLNAGFTLFLDEVEAGQALSHFRGFRGEATGRLHGKIRLFVREGGKALRLNDAFLYSTPGETGKLRMLDSTAVTDNLALAGLDDATRANVANALTDLDYSVLKLSLRRGEGKAATLTTRISGTATRGDTSAPVDITLNFNGELEQIINTGLNLSNQLKGTTK